MTSGVENASAPAPELLQAADAAKKGDAPHRATVRTLLSWFQAQRRGSFIVWYIRRRLRELGIATDPDFNSVWIDSEVAFVPFVESNMPDTAETGTDSPTQFDGSAVLTVEGTQAAAAASLVGGAIEDPTYRIGKLDAANKPVVSVAPTQSVEQAVTQMLANSFSQLPVMQGDRDVKGVITWESIGAREAGERRARVYDLRANHQLRQSLFDAIGIIAQDQYVLMQGSDKRIAGIVTSADLSRQFQQLTEPFLLLSEIEQHIRKLIVGKFTAEELKSACDPSDSERKIDNVADLTMGEYIRLLENPKYWERLVLRIYRASLVEQLQIVRRIRNDIMHFDPDPLGASDLQSLRQFVVFMQSLRELGF